MGVGDASCATFPGRALVCGAHAGARRGACVGRKLGVSMAAPLSTPYAFVQQGSFSGTSAGLRSGLDPAFGVESTVIDVHDYRRFGRGSVLNAPLRNLPWLVREHRQVARHDPRTFVARRLETSFMFEHRSAVARERVRAEALGAPFTLQTATVFDARTPGLPHFIYTDHTMLAYRRYGRWSEDLRGRERWVELERVAYHGASAIFTTSEFARVSLIEDYGVPEDRVLDARSGTNIVVPAEPIVRDAAPRRIVFIGKQWERKGGPLVLDAFRRARRDHPDLELIVAGCSPEIDEPGARVRGVITREAVAELLRSADAFAMPSFVEPSAIVYSEASAYSLPVLATAVGGTPERVVDGVTGLLSPPGDADALAANLLRLLDEPGLAPRLGQAGFALVAEQFNWRVVGEFMADEIQARL